MKKRIRDIMIFLVAIAVQLIFVLYFVLTIYFKNHFFWGTVIEGKEVGGKTLNQAEQILQDSDYKLEIKERLGKKEVIEGSTIDFKYKVEGDLKSLKRKQQSYSWPVMNWMTRKFEIEREPLYDEMKLKQRIRELICFDDTKMIPPQDAKLIYRQGSYSIEPEVEGTTIHKQLLSQCIREAVKNEESVIDLADLGCYKENTVKANSPQLIALKEKFNHYLSNEIIYDFGDRSEKVGREQIHDWLTKGEKVSIDREKVRHYIDTLAEKYDTVGRTREFKTSEGEIVQVAGGDYGWSINREEEVKRLIEIIEKGNQHIKIKPIYRQEAYCRNSNDIGEDYVEVNLTKQYLWFYRKGQLVTEGAIVSGTVADGHATPPGVYSIDYKQAHAILRGPGYACPVSFWMPFYNGMGIHDATWRGQFGGQIYQYNGSHGCINSPYSLAEKIFEQMEPQIPIICYIS